MATSTIAPAGDTIFFFHEWEEPYGYLSQWFACSFIASATAAAGENAQEMTFLTTEQYMMYQKAILFKDFDVADQIMLETEPKKQKALGRKVKGFNHVQWDASRERIVEDGNHFKFTQSKEADMRTKLLETGSRELVEASPFDRIWGVGYGAARAEENRANWGQNLLGKALMRVRSRLQEEKREQGVGKSRTGSMSGVQ